MKIGYARCSTDEQDLLPRSTLQRLGVEPAHLHPDLGYTGTNRNRPGCSRRSPPPAAPAMSWW